MRKDQVNVAVNAIFALGRQGDDKGVETVRRQLELTRGAIPLGEVSIGDLVMLLHEAHSGVNERAYLVEDYRDVLREAVAEVGTTIADVRQDVLTRAAAKLKALVITDEQKLKDDDVP